MLRRFLIGLTVAALLAVSIGIGVVVALWGLQVEG
jgi:hypothetical protein